MKISESQLKEIIREEVENAIEEGIASKIALGAALIGSMLGISPAAEASIQVSKDTIAQMPMGDMVNDAGQLATSEARVVYGLMTMLEQHSGPERASEISQAKEMFHKAWKTKKTEHLLNLPQVAQNALEVSISLVRHATGFESAPGMEKFMTGLGLDPNSPDVGGNIDDFLKKMQAIGQKAGIK